MPVIGDTVIYKDINKNTFTELTGVTGVGVTWDYTGLYEASATFPFYYMDPADMPAPQPDSFPQATVCDSSPGINGHFYFRLAGNNFYRDGIWSSSLMMPYNDPLKLYELPFAFGTNFTDSYTGVGSMGSGIDSVYINNGTYSFDVQGVGTLKLPTGRFDSVFRVMYSEDFAIKFDLISPGATLLTVSEYGYEYWKQGQVRPILTFYQTTIDDMSGGHSVTKSVKMNKQAIPDGPNSGVVENSLPELNIYPNPATGPVNIEFTGNGNTLIELFDVVGKLLYSENSMMNKIVIDLSNFQSGLYQIKITSEAGSSVTKKLILK
jgi:hypothetical protein